VPAFTSGVAGVLLTVSAPLVVTVMGPLLVVMPSMAAIAPTAGIDPIVTPVASL
jgi:hypothetical protein